MKLHFNSIKVQLKQQGTDHYYESPEFQFHKGTIKTPAAQSFTLP